jgi:chaperonin GroEL
MIKESIRGAEGRARVKKGIDEATKDVAPTLGAVGMTAMIEFPGLDPLDADDGITILKSLEYEDKYEQMGLQRLRKAAMRTSEEGGDGTATTTVLTSALVNEAFKLIEKDSSMIREVRERLQKGLVEVLGELEKGKKEVTLDDIEKVATISSLDPEVAKLIAEVIREVGVNGVITVEKGAKLGYTSEVVKGARFES